MGETSDFISAQQFKLDIKDIRIFNALYENSRCTYSALAKKAKISRELAAYRVNRLLENKIINGFVTIINTKALGFLKYDIYLRFQKMHEEKENEIIGRLKKEKSITWIATVGGNYDLALQVSVKSIEQFDRVLTQVLTACGDCISNYVIMNVLRENSSPMNLLGEKIEPSAHRGKPDGSFRKELDISKSRIFEGSVKIDDKDKAILRILAGDARASFMDLSARVSLTPNAVSYRIKKLIEQGVIAGFIATPSFPLLGLEWDFILLKFKNFTNENEKSFLYFMEQHPHICYGAKLVGNWNYAVSIASKGPMHLRKILMELRDVFKDTLHEYETIRIFNQHKFIVTLGDDEC